MSNNSTGRPTVINKATVQKLEQALKDGFSVARACSLSGISRSTYYAHLQTDTDFMDKMELSQAWATERAKQVVIQAIDKGDLKAAQWWLERKSRSEFSNNLPQGLDRSDGSMSIANEYYGGDENKMIEHMLKTLEAIAEPTKTQV
jgi:arylamine N-acetyltransferase